MLTAVKGLICKMTKPDIFIIEDNFHDVEMIQDALQELDMNVGAQVFKDGAEAAKYFFNPTNEFIAEKLQPPCVVLLDLKLPKINGLELLKLLKSNEETKHIPVVIFTSSNEEKDRMESYALGANSYLVKPLDADEFSKYIKQIINYWVKMNAKAN
jgi:two-component system response regulator